MTTPPTTPGEGQEAERAEFEAWMQKEHPTHPLKHAKRIEQRWNTVEYVSAGTQHKWLGWQARASLSPKQGEQPAPETENLPAKAYPDEPDLVTLARTVNAEISRSGEWFVTFNYKSLASYVAAIRRPLETCQCEACRPTIHASDCAVHNEPAMSKGLCDCGASAGVRMLTHDEAWSEFIGATTNSAGIEAIQRKFMEVNGLSLCAAPPAGTPRKTKCGGDGCNGCEFCWSSGGEGERAQAAPAPGGVKEGHRG